jgi:hypothetical protein
MNDLYPVVTNAGKTLTLDSNGRLVGLPPSGPNLANFTNLTFGSGTFSWGSYPGAYSNLAYITPFPGYGAGVSAIVQPASGILTPGGSFVGFGVTMSQSQTGFVVAQCANASGAAVPAGSYMFFTYLAWTTV